jgi:oligosaccharide reducing-end xylanase
MTYRNIFAELGYAQTEIDKKVADGWRTIFEGKERFYFEGPEETSYMMDTGNIDARTEGMSYGMMMAVQMDRKDIFDRIWKWSRTYMFMNEGKHKGYFAWSCAPDGKKNALGPAPDGEEYFAAALYFASSRWGDGAGILDYSAQATALLQTCLHQGEREGDSKESRPIWDSENHLIRFVPEVDFYEIFGERAGASDRNFWKKAAEASRDYIALSCLGVFGAAYARKSAIKYTSLCCQRVLAY